jgi:hypothetical protein
VGSGDQNMELRGRGVHTSLTSVGGREARGPD